MPPILCLTETLRMVDMFVSASKSINKGLIKNSRGWVEDKGALKIVTPDGLKELGGGRKCRLPINIHFVPCAL